jgi:phage replication O-like protein O
MQLEQPLSGYNGKPEIDDGHTKIANELLDAIIQADFSKRQLKILLFIMRKTYGWNKPEDDIARSQMVDATNMHNPHITKTIQELLEMNVIIVSQGSHAKRYRINKYYDTWRMTEMVIVTKTVIKPKLVIVTETVTENYQNSNNPLPKQSPQKTTPKDNTKDIAAKVKTSAISLKKFIEQCKQENKPVLSKDSIVFKNAEKLNIDPLWLRACWLKFKEAHIEKNKRQSDWIATFNNCVKDNWYKIWYKDNDGNMILTSQGRIAIDYYKEQLNA